MDIFGVGSVFGFFYPETVVFVSVFGFQKCFINFFAKPKIVLFFKNVGSFRFFKFRFGFF